MSEILYQHLFNLLNIPIVLLDDSGKVVAANPAFIALIPEKKDRLIGKTTEELLPGIAPQNAISSLLSAKRNTIKITIPRRKSKKSYRLNSISPFRKDSRNIHFIIFNEITETTELKTRINRLEQDLQTEKRFSVFGHLTPGIVHNINNLLAVIIGRTQLMQIKYPDIPDTTSIQERADLIKDLVDALSYKISNESNTDRIPVNISTLLRNELAVLNADPFYKHMVQKQVNLDENIPEINAYYKDLSTALLSVVNFSLDSMLPVKQKNLSIVSRCDSEFVIVNITDTGTKAETTDHFPSSKTYQSPRMGKQIVNLQQARELLATYNGSIDLVKNDSGGKEFLIKIPC